MCVSTREAAILREASRSKSTKARLMPPQQRKAVTVEEHNCSVVL